MGLILHKLLKYNPDTDHLIHAVYWQIHFCYFNLAVHMLNVLYILQFQSFLYEWNISVSEIMSIYFKNIFARCLFIHWLKLNGCSCSVVLVLASICVLNCNLPIVIPKGPTFMRISTLYICWIQIRTILTIREITRMIRHEYTHKLCTIVYT